MSQERILTQIRKRQAAMASVALRGQEAIWPFCGYNEIQNPRRKNILIDYDRLKELAAVESYERFKQYHKGWVEEHLGDGNNIRNDKWTKGL